LNALTPAGCVLLRAQAPHAGVTVAWPPARAASPPPRAAPAPPARAAPPPPPPAARVTPPPQRAAQAAPPPPAARAASGGAGPSAPPAAPPAADAPAGSGSVGFPRRAPSSMELDASVSKATAAQAAAVAAAAAAAAAAATPSDSTSAPTRGLVAAFSKLQAAYEKLQAKYARAKALKLEQLVRRRRAAARGGARMRPAFQICARAQTFAATAFGARVRSGLCTRTHIFFVSRSLILSLFFKCSQEQLGDEQKALLSQHGEAAGRLVDHWRGEAERYRAAAESGAAREAAHAATARELLDARNAALALETEALAARADALDAARNAAADRRRAAAAEATAEHLRAELDAANAAAGVPDGPLTAEGIVRAVGANAFATPAFESMTGLRWRRPAGAPAGVHEFTHAASGFSFRLERAEPHSSDDEGEEDDSEDDDDDDDGWGLAYTPLNADAAGVMEALPAPLRERIEFERSDMPVVLGRLLCSLGTSRHYAPAAGAGPSPQAPAPVLTRPQMLHQQRR
jgi:hypothetical protein